MHSSAVWSPHPKSCSVAERFYRIVMRWSAEDVTGCGEPAHIHHPRPAQCMPGRLGPVCHRPISGVFAPAPCRWRRSLAFKFKWRKFFFLLFLCPRSTCRIVVINWKSTVAEAWIMPLPLLIWLHCNFRDGVESLWSNRRKDKQIFTD